MTTTLQIIQQPPTKMLKTKQQINSQKANILNTYDDEDSRVIYLNAKIIENNQS